EAEVALRMAARQAAVFIQVEGLYFPERNITGAVTLDKIVVGALGGTARGQAQGAVRLAADQVSDELTGGGAELLVVLDGDDLHAPNPGCNLGGSARFYSGMTAGRKRRRAGSPQNGANADQRQAI